VTANITPDGNLEFAIGIPAVNEKHRDAINISGTCGGYRAQLAIIQIFLVNLVRGCVVWCCVVLCCVVLCCVVLCCVVLCCVVLCCVVLCCVMFAPLSSL